MDGITVKAIVFEMGNAPTEVAPDTPVLRVHVVPDGMSVFNPRSTIDLVFPADEAVMMLRDTLNRYLKVRSAKDN